MWPKRGSSRNMVGKMMAWRQPALRVEREGKAVEILEHRERGQVSRRSFSVRGRIPFIGWSNQGNQHPEHD